MIIYNFKVSSLYEHESGVRIGEGSQAADEPEDLIARCNDRSAALAEQELLLNAFFKILWRKADAIVLGGQLNPLLSRAVPFALPTPYTDIEMLNQRTSRGGSSDVIDHIDTFRRADFRARPASNAAAGIKARSTSEGRYGLIGSFWKFRRVGSGKECAEHMQDDASLEERRQFHDVRP